jgi:hypothetical protein
LCIKVKKNLKVSNLNLTFALIFLIICSHLHILSMNCKPLHVLMVIALVIAIAPFSLIAQKSSKKSKVQAPTIPLEVRVARIDSIVGTMEASLETYSVQTADRNDGSNQEKVFAYSLKDAPSEGNQIVRNELVNSNGRTENHFYHASGQVLCWTLYREETTKQSPRPRKRFTKYYFEDGVVFHSVERVAPISEDLEAQGFVPLPISEVSTMSEFMNRKYQHILDAFNQGWKVTDNTAQEAVKN